MSDAETIVTNPDAGRSAGADRVWHRIGRLSAWMFLFAFAIFLLRAVQMASLRGQPEPTVASICVGVLALGSFVSGTFLGDLWAVHAVVTWRRSRGDRCPARTLNPVVSLILTCKCGTLANESIERDILSAKVLFLLPATLISAASLIVLWTQR